MSTQHLPSVIKKEIIERWFNSNESANTIADILKLPVGTVLQVIADSRAKKIHAPLITDDKIPFDAVVKSEHA